MAKLFTSVADWLSVNAAVVTTPPFSMHVWVKHTALGNLENLISLGTIGSGDNRFYLSKTADDQAHAIERDATSAQANGANITDTNWHGYTGVFTNDSFRTISTDGGATGSNSITRAPTAPDSLYFARSQSGTANALTGKLAYGAIWNRVLTATEISNLAITTPLIAAPSGLVAYYIFLNNALDTAGSNDLTVTGSAGYDTDMPSLNLTTPASAAVTSVGQVPTLRKERTIAPGVGLATSGGFVSAIRGGPALPLVGGVTMGGQIPTVTIVIGPLRNPGVGLVSAVGQVPGLLKIRIITPDINTSDADEVGLSPIVIWGGITAPAQAPLAFVGQVPMIIAAGSFTCAPGLGFAQLQGLLGTAIPQAGQDGTALPSINAVEALGLVPSIFGQVTCVPAPATLEVTTFAIGASATILGWHNAPTATASAWH